MIANDYQISSLLYYKYYKILKEFIRKFVKKITVFANKGLKNEYVEVIVIYCHYYIIIEKKRLPLPLIIFIL
jgi:hypothetical protein